MTNYTVRIKSLIVSSAYAMESNHPWRWGQSVYNTAWSLWPDVIREMPNYVDPFRDDSKVDFFLQWLDARLSN